MIRHPRLKCCICFLFRQIRAFARSLARRSAASVRPRIPLRLSVVARAKIQFPLSCLPRSLAHSMDLSIRLVASSFTFEERRLRRVSISLSGMTSLCHVFLDDVLSLSLFFVGSFSQTECVKWTSSGSEADDSPSVWSPCGVSSSSPSSAR